MSNPQAPALDRGFPSGQRHWLPVFVFILVSLIIRDRNCHRIDFAGAIRQALFRFPRTGTTGVVSSSSPIWCRMFALKVDSRAPAECLPDKVSSRQIVNRWKSAGCRHTAPRSLYAAASIRLAMAICATHGLQAVRRAPRRYMPYRACRVRSSSFGRPADSAHSRVLSGGGNFGATLASSYSAFFVFDHVACPFRTNITISRPRSCSEIT